MHPFVQEACWNASIPLFVDSEHLIHHSALSLSRLRRNETYRDALGLTKTLFDLLLHPFDCLFLVLVFDEVPLVGHDYDCSPLVQYSFNEGHVRSCESLSGIDHDGDDMRVLNRIKDILLDHIVDICSICLVQSQSCRINKRDPTTTVHPLHPNCISCRTRQVISYHSLLLHQCIYQCRFTRVWFPNDRKLNRFSFHRILTWNLLLARRAVVSTETVEAIQRIHIIIRVEITVFFRVAIDLVKFFFPRSNEIMHLAV